MVILLQVCPLMLVKKDRGRYSDKKARPKAFGEVNVANSVPGIELLQQDDDNNVRSDESDFCSTSNEDDSLSIASDYVSKDEYDDREEGYEADVFASESEEYDDDRESDSIDDEEESDGDYVGCEEGDKEESDGVYEEESDGVYDIDEEDKEKLSARKRKFFGHDERVQ